LTYNANPSGDGHSDENLERVRLGGNGLVAFSEHLAAGMEPFFQYTSEDGFEAAGYAIDDAKIRLAANDAMLREDYSWCDRCRVLALHEPGANRSNVRELWGTCLADQDLVDVIGSGPDPENLRLRGSDCTLCPDRFTSNDNGGCRFCPDFIEGNTCLTCSVDVVFDANTTPPGVYEFDVAQAFAGDSCPSTFTVELANVEAWFAGDVDYIRAATAPSNSSVAACERPFRLTYAYEDVAGNSVGEENESTGEWIGCSDPMCPLPECHSMPFMPSLRSTDIAAGSVLVNTPAMSEARLVVDLHVEADEPDPR
jgi:hypothetical protein